MRCSALTNGKFIFGKLFIIRLFQPTRFCMYGLLYKPVLYQTAFTVMEKNQKLETFLAKTEGRKE